MKMTKTKMGIGTLVTSLLLSVSMLSGSVMAATQEEFNNLVGAIPVIALISIFAIWLLSEMFKK